MVPKQTLIRGGQMLVLGIMIEITTWIIYLLALLQFGWCLIAQHQNKAVAALGATLSEWIQKASAFLTGASQNKPFPWGDKHNDKHNDEA